MTVLLFQKQSLSDDFDILMWIKSNFMENTPNLLPVSIVFILKLWHPSILPFIKSPKQMPV